MIQIKISIKLQFFSSFWKKRCKSIWKNPYARTFIHVLHWLLRSTSISFETIFRWQNRTSNCWNSKTISVSITNKILFLFIFRLYYYVQIINSLLNKFLIKPFISKLFKNNKRFIYFEKYEKFLDRNYIE